MIVREGFIESKLEPTNGLNYIRGASMLILGLDCASKTGWSLYDSDLKKTLESGVQDFTKKRGESNGLLFLKFRRWLDDLIQMNPEISMIAYEQAHHRGGAATEICVNLVGRAQEVAAQYGILTAPVRTNTLKLFATGHGNADKGMMIEAAGKVLGRKPIDDNEADATMISIWCAVEYG